MSDNLGSRNLKYILRLVLIFCVYYISAKFGLRFAFINESATSLWPPTGITIAAYLLFGYRVWPAILLGAFFTNVTTAGTILTSIAIALGNTLEGLLASYLVNKYAQGKYAFDRARDIFLFVILAGFLSTLISATIGVTSLALFEFVSWDSYLSVWQTWWLGDVAGAIMITPLIVLWVTKPISKWKSLGEVLKAGIFISAAVFTSMFVFSGIFPYPYLCIPVLMWIAFHFGQRAGITAVFLMSLVAIWLTLNGTGPYVNAGVNVGHSLILVQFFVGTATVTTLILASLANELKQFDERIKSTIDSIGDGIVATDALGRIVMINKAFEDIFGYKKSEAVGKVVFEIINAQDEKGNSVPVANRALTIAFTTGSRVSKTHYLVSKNNIKFPAHIVATPIILDNKIIGAEEVIRDITVEKQIDRSKSEFVSLASHQLRTPPSIVKWYVELLLKSPDFPKLTDKQKDYINRIQQAADRMIILVNTLLNVSRLELGTFRTKIETVDIVKVAKDAILELELDIKAKNLQIEEEYDPKLSKIQADLGGLTIVFQNLLSNAVKYTERNGKISIKIGLLNNQIIITVKDTGYGIPKDEQSKIFTKLFRSYNVAQHVSEGNGLGLYIVKSILSRMNSTISFESVEGKGTTFTVVLQTSKK